MKRILLCLCVCFITELFACDIGSVLVPARAIMKDQSEISAYFILPSELYLWENPPYGGPDGVLPENGTDFVPLIKAHEDDFASEFFYTQDYKILPWGNYYITENTFPFDIKQAEHLIYDKGKSTVSFFPFWNWRAMSARDLQLIQTGIRNIQYSCTPFYEYIYLSTRDSISTAELELYSLEGNVEEATVKQSNRRSFFYETDANIRTREQCKTRFKYNENDSFEGLIRDLASDQAELKSLLPLVQRNILMDQKFKATLLEQINSALQNLDLMIAYLELPDKRNREAKKLFTNILGRLNNPALNKLPSREKLCAVYTAILLPRFDNYYYTEIEEETVDALARLGIVRLEGNYDY